MKTNEFRQFLSESGHEIQVACDTEFEDTHTLTVQFATLINSRIVVQIYSSPAIPQLVQKDALAQRLATKFTDHCEGVVVRPVKPIIADLSPARVIKDLFRLKNTAAIKRTEVDTDEANECQQLRLFLIGHYWPADFLRIFGSNFFKNLFESGSALHSDLAISGHKVLTFGTTGKNANNYQKPIVEFLDTSDARYGIRASAFDTSLPFGKTSLKNLARTLINIDLDQNLYFP